MPDVDPGVITPVDASIVAIDAGVMLHVPPASASLMVVVDPEHTFMMPVIGAGKSFTVTIAVTTLDPRL